MDIDHLRQWIGRRESRADVATPAPLAGLAALLDHDTPPWADNELPPLAHWLYFLPHVRQSEIDIDGHPRRGGFLPPVDLPRRMFAGGTLTFHAPITIGAKLARNSTIIDVSEKNGASGRLVFVTLQHEIFADTSVAVTENQDIVYREAALGPSPPLPAPKTTPRTAEYTHRINPDPTLLFRFSALTFNAHRIHYDRDYCRDVEFYPGLVVQGPFIATLLLDHLVRLQPATRLREFSFRARNPLYDTATFDLNLSHGADGIDLWACDAEGREAMTAKAIIRG